MGRRHTETGGREGESPCRDFALPLDSRVVPVC